ncbi:MAG TPA: LacI family DNA-binding transcriptional regulator [Ktedonobacteraceae bacterium]|nr:LacI family DNA-binding transcriptional regulator [Ktedonobacteraceae bacterium]
MNDRKQGKAPLIYDVARIANVSIGTVSRVINDIPGVKPATRQRVLAAIDELDYSPNLIARSMSSKRTGSIGVIVPFFTRPFFSEVLRAVEVTMTQAGRELVLYNVQSNEQCNFYFRTLPKKRKVDGLLVISIFPDDATVTGFKRADLPVVLVDAYHPLLTSLVVDNVEGAYQAVKCLIEHGHRRIGFINGVIEGDFRFNRANDRLIGLHRALSEAGLLFEPELVLTAEWDRQGGRQAAMQLLTRQDRPTAIFAASDMHAIGVLEAARSLNLAVPADLSLIGYDGIELSEIMELCTIQQPMKYMGELGVQKLIAQIEDSADGGSSSPPELIRLRPSLIMRNTVTTPPPLSEATNS